MTRVHSKEKTTARDLSLFIASNRFLNFRTFLCGDGRDKNVIVLRSKRHKTLVNGASRNYCKSLSNIVGSRVFKTRLKGWAFS